MLAYFLFKLGRFLAVHMPLSVGYALATGFSILKYYISPRDRLAVLGNLKHILNQEDQSLICVYAKKVFISFGKYLLEFFRMSLLSRDDLNRLVHIQGLEHIQKAQSQGKGVIIVSGHIGNWEMGGVFMSLIGYPMLAVALPHSHRRVNAFFNKQRERMGMMVVQTYSAAMRKLFVTLKNNGIIALIGDRDFTNAGVKMPFLGLTKMIPRGPAVLSLRTGAPIVVGFVVRQPDNTQIIEFQPPIEPKPGISEMDLIGLYTRAIEAKIRQCPEQWLMFREFWKE